jgi:hypothetical protein
MVLSIIHKATIRYHIYSLLKQMVLLIIHKTTTCKNKNENFNAPK